MSDLLAFDDDDGNLFVPDEQTKSKKPTKSLDDIFSSTDNSGAPSTTLDDILTAQPQEDLFKPQAKPQEKAKSSKMYELFGADEDDEFDIFSTSTKPSQTGEIKAKSGDSRPSDSLDLLLDNSSLLDFTDKSHGVSHDESHDSLDMLLDAQPSGTVSASDDLLSLMDPFAKNPVSHTENIEKEKQFDLKTKSETTQDKNLFDQDDKSDFSEKSGGVLPEDNLVTSSEIKSKPGEHKKVDQSDVTEKSGGVLHDDPQHSLDMLLDAQPSGTVPASDNLMSVLDVQKYDSPFDSNFQEEAEQKHIDQLEPEDKSHDSVTGNSWSLESKKQSHVGSHENPMDNLDMLLDAQPSGTVSSSDDLLSVVDPYNNNRVISSNKQTVAWEQNKDSPGETTDPIDDFFGTSAPGDSGSGEVTQTRDTTETSTVTAPSVPKTNLKKSMERSFEDLLTGLSDESEPELDDMIDDTNDNTNLESLLVTPNKSVTGPATTTYSHSTPYSSIKPPDNTDPPKDSLLGDYDFGSLKSVEPASKGSNDVLSSSSVSPSEDMDAPKDSLLEDYDFGSMKPSAPEVKVHKPYDDEGTESLDIKSWEMVDQDDVGDVQAEDTEVVMRHRNGSQRSQSESEDIDLSAIEDTNHLDVDVNKHRSALGKKGSLALRRKPSRKSRKSLMSTGEDAIFQDSTDPKPSGMLNGEEDEGSDGGDQEAFDLSPPAKKHSPSTMIPLPGFPTKPPPRLSASSPQDEEMEPPQEARRISKPPPGAFRLPPVMPRQAKASPGEAPCPTQSTPSDSSSHEFEKPALRATKPNENRATEPEASVGFGTPMLKKVGQQDSRRRLGSEERDMTFEKPALRSTPKPGLDRDGEEKMDTNTGVFMKPQLRSNQQAERFTKPVDDQPVETYEPRMLRSTPKRDIETRTESDKHVFDKPKLRTTGRTLAAEENQNSAPNSNESANTFEKPVLKSAKKDFRSDSFGDSNDSPSHAFEKPLLKNTPNRPSSGNENTKKEQFITGVFEKPSLKKATPSPEKEVKPFSEPKGMFDKPALRKTDGSRAAEQSRAKSAEKPTWLQTAAEKKTKVLDALQTKENHNASNEKEVPSWLESHPARKNIVGLPLQESSSNRTDVTNTENIKMASTPRSRESSVGSEADSYTKKTPTGSAKTTEAHNNYTPAWMRQGRSPSSGAVPGLTSLTPARSCPEVPQWKRELAQRRLSRKDSPSSEIPKKEETKEPEWKRNVQLRKVQPRESPSKESQSSEPEWMKKAEEKRARLRRSIKNSETHKNYAPARVRQRRSSSSGAVTGTSRTPAKSCPSLASDEVSQWKMELTQRRLSKTDSPSLEISKKEKTKEPDWKRNTQLRKVQPRESPSKDSHSSEPQWVKKAKEKRARLQNIKSLQYSNLNLK